MSLNLNNSLRILIVMLLVGSSLAVSFAQSKMDLPDVSSGTPYNELRYPKEKWSEELLKNLYKGPQYLSKDEVFEIDPAPANDSETTKRELEVLGNYKKEKRDENTVAIIIRENQNAPILDIFEREGLFVRNDATERVAMGAAKEAGYFILREKMHFERARPTQLAPELTLVIDVPQHPAYPSGHAGQSYAVALVLSKLDPENETRYKQLAMDIAQRREIAGVHYPSDSEAGRKLATQVVEKLMNVPEYQEKFKKAQEAFVKPQAKVE